MENFQFFPEKNSDSAPRPPTVLVVAWAAYRRFPAYLDVDRAEFECHHQQGPHLTSLELVVTTPQVVRHDHDREFEFEAEISESFDRTYEMKPIRLVLLVIFGYQIYH